MNNAVINRKNEIDYLKAFSITLVVMYHVIMLSEVFWGDLTWICISIALEDVHVPLFIFIAGYLCHPQDIPGFYRKKVLRILIPCLFMTCLKLLFTNLVSPGYPHAGAITDQLFEAFICGGLYWFCYALLVMFLLAPLFWNSKALIWILLAASFGVNIWFRRSEIEVTDILQLTRTLNMLPFFLCGMLFAKYRMDEVFSRKKIQYITLAAALAAGAVCGYFRFHEDVNRSYYIDFILGLSLMYLLYFAAVRVKTGAGAGILSRIGHYSLQIMLLDGFYRILLFEVFQRFMPEGILQMLLVTVLVVALSCLTCMAVEKIPVLSSLLGLRYINGGQR